ncbi:MAG: NAD(P)-dependent oxidoreductase [Patescibacteria group bacterium]|nr:NAD(P)-dependent oxidoreductase [bacterium]MDZ4240961.1 NAD(P)-dependent oxidoreductase [Patescibacteria group bacterium]
MKIGVFKYEDWEKEHLEKGLRGTHEIVFFTDCLTKDSVLADTDFETILVFVDSAVTAETLNKFPNLKLVATRSTGYDHIDLAAAKERGITVAYVPAYGEETVAEYTFALLLSLTRKIYESYDRVREEGSFALTGLRGVDLNKKTIGVIGTGKIGKNVIQIAKGFDMNVIAYDPYPSEDSAKKFGFSYKSFEDVLKESDVITIHVPYMESTHHLLNGKAFSLMKKGTYLINTSRGGIIETTALVDALNKGIIAGAGLDVLEEEGAIKDELHLLTEGHYKEHDLKTVLADHVLIDMPNVIVTPHNAFNTNEALRRITDTTIQNVNNFMSGGEVFTVK